MKITSNDIKKVIKREIKWCEDNPLPKKEKDYENGFIKGLRQVYSIIETLELLEE
jgi:hypothetical protein